MKARRITIFISLGVMMGIAVMPISAPAKRPSRNGSW